MGKYRKAIVAGVGAAVLGLAAWLGDAHPAVQFAITAATAFGVYEVPNA